MPVRFGPGDVFGSNHTLLKPPRFPLIEDLVHWLRGVVIILFVFFGGLFYTLHGNPPLQQLLEASSELVVTVTTDKTVRRDVGDGDRYGFAVGTSTVQAHCNIILVVAMPRRAKVLEREHLVRQYM